MTKAEWLVNKFVEENGTARMSMCSIEDANEVASILINKGIEFEYTTLDVCHIFKKVRKG